MADVIAYANTGVVYKNGTVVTGAGVVPNLNTISVEIERSTIVQQSGVLDTRFDDCGVSGNYYFT